MYNRFINIAIVLFELNSYYKKSARYSSKHNVLTVNGKTIDCEIKYDEYIGAKVPCISRRAFDELVSECSSN